MRAAWWFARLAAGTSTAGSRSLMHWLEATSLLAWLPAPPPHPSAPWTRAKELKAVPLPQVAPGGRRKRGDAGCATPMGHLFRTPPEASEYCWWGRGGRPPGSGRAEARQSSATTTIGSAATTTTTTIGPTAATTNWG
jgi:hypothetical protein